MESIFAPLAAEGLTTLRIRHNFKTGKFTFFAGREWEPGLDFSTYNKAFGLTDILTEDNTYLGTGQVRAMYEKHGLSLYLDKVLELMSRGKHLGIDFLYHEGLGVRFICGIHSEVRGRNNKSFTTFAGATRRHGLEDKELDVIIDALNLSRAMTFKNIAVDIPYGGCKTTLHMEQVDVTNMKLMGFLAYACDTTHCITGPDMNLPKTMVKVMNDNFSMQYCGGPGSALGDTAVPTSLGAYLALKQAVRFRTGSESLDGMKVAVQGLGAVGYAMAVNLCQEKVALFVSDLDSSKADALKNQCPNSDITFVKPEEIMALDADILCPCAMGGILGETEINAIKFKYVFGPANNQLRASSQEEEIRLAKLLAGRGILFQTEWWHNAAGVLGAAMEYIHGRDITVTNEDLVSRVREIIPRKTWENLNNAKNLGITPTESAYLQCQDLIYK